MILQVLINGLFAGLTWGLLAVGFTMIYRVVCFFHVAYATTYLVGAYTGVVLMQRVTTSVFFAGFTAVLAAGVAGCLIELSVYGPLRRKHSSALVLLIASLAVVVVAQNLIGLLFGSEIRVSNLGELQRVLQVGGARITFWRLFCGGLSLLLSLCFWLIANRTNLGKQMRAVSSDKELACALGIKTERVILATIVCGSMLAGGVGFLVGSDTAVSPSNGLSVLLIAVAAAIVGGIGSIRGAMLGGLFIGITQHLGAWILPVHWQDTIVFIVLILFLFLKPDGLLGKPVRMASV